MIKGFECFEISIYIIVSLGKIHLFIRLCISSLVFTRESKFYSQRRNILDEILFEGKK